MKLFAKYPWLESIALSGNGEPLVNGFCLSELKHPGLVNWAHQAKAACDDVRRELGGSHVLGFAIWRHELEAA